MNKAINWPYYLVRNQSGQKRMRICMRFTENTKKRFPKHFENDENVLAPRHCAPVYNNYKKTDKLVRDRVPNSRLLIFCCFFSSVFLPLCLFVLKLLGAKIFLRHNVNKRIKYTTIHASSADNISLFI